MIQNTQNFDHKNLIHKKTVENNQEINKPTLTTSVKIPVIFAGVLATAALCYKNWINESDATPKNDKNINKESINKIKKHLITKIKENKKPKEIIQTQENTNKKTNIYYYEVDGYCFSVEAAKALKETANFCLGIYREAPQITPNYCRDAIQRIYGHLNLKTSKLGYCVE